MSTTASGSPPRRLVSTVPPRPAHTTAGSPGAITGDSFKGFDLASGWQRCACCKAAQHCSATTPRLLQNCMLSLCRLGSPFWCSATVVFFFIFIIRSCCGGLVLSSAVTKPWVAAGRCQHHLTPQQLLECLSLADSKPAAALQHAR